MGKDFRATISPESPRAQAWLDVFGSHEIPLRSPIPIAASAPSVEAGLFFELDLQEITQGQRARLIAHIAKTFGVDKQEVEETLDTVGCPILDEDVTITVFNPLKWL